MACQNPGCIKQTDYNRVAHYARKRYVEGIATIVLLCDARAKDERKRVVLASLLVIDDDKFRDLMPFAAAYASVACSSSETVSGPWSNRSVVGAAQRNSQLLVISGGSGYRLTRKRVIVPRQIEAGTRLLFYYFRLL